MAGERLFGTDGIRGLAGAFPLDEPTVERTGFAVAQVLQRTARASPRVLIGRDTRESGPQIEAALARGLVGGGAQVHSGGVLTTPAVATLTKLGGFAAGVVISASHNAYRDNGLKVFSSYGYKLSDAVEGQIERLVLNPAEKVEVASDTPALYPKGATDPLLKTRYLAALRSALGPDFTFGGRPVVLDCANGAASGCAPELFARLGADVHPLGVAPDGRNINDGCGSLHTEALALRVVREGAILGVAYDGDADRCILVDETGVVCDGDDILAVAATAMHAAGGLGGGGEIVSTVMANLGLENYARSLGLGFIRTPVGDKQVLDEMLRREATLGGEQSGHVLFLEHATTGDGILTSLLLSEIILRSGTPLSKLAACWTRLPQVLTNVRVRARVPLEEVPQIVAGMARLEESLGAHGRLLVRYSGTEPLLRIMLEGRDQDEIEALATELAEIVRKTLG